LKGPALLTNDATYKYEVYYANYKFILEGPDFKTRDVDIKFTVTVSSPYNEYTAFKEDGSIDYTYVPVD
jgi:hypothetical protein